MGHYAKCCKSSRKTNHLADEEAYSADEDDWISDRVHSIQQQINSMGTKSKNGPPVYTKTILVNNRPRKSIVDTGSPVTIISKRKFSNITIFRPVTEDYRDVNDNRTKFEGKMTVNVEIDGKVGQLELLITSKQKSPLLGLNWMEKLGITMKTENPQETVNRINKPDQTNRRPDKNITMLKNKFHKLFTKNHTTKNV